MGLEMRISLDKLASLSCLRNVELDLILFALSAFKSERCIKFSATMFVCAGLWRVMQESF